MNSPLACLAILASAALTALVPAQPPAPPPAEPAPATSAPASAPAQPDSLSTWRDRAARAEAWLKARTSEAQQASNGALSLARRELLGVESPVVASTLSIATRSTDAGADPAATVWKPVGEHRFAINQQPEESVVLLVHGLDEPGTIWDELTPHLFDKGAVVLRFDYPNDQALATSAMDLAAALRRLRSLGVDRVSIVAHSMGGLVAREVLTCDHAYAGNAAATAELPAIDRLIMCGTPNHGSPLAGLQTIAEAREQFYRHFQGTAAEGSGLIGFTGDGCGEAGRDLAENSDFLTTLNARPLPTHVRMTTICGVVTPAKACEYLKTEASTQWAGFLGSDRAAALTAQACAAVQTLGDGIVPAASTHLDGVDDHVNIAADHRSMLKRWTILNKIDELRGVKTPPAEAIPVILDRLGLEPIPTDQPVDPAPRAE